MAPSVPSSAFPSTAPDKARDVYRPWYNSSHNGQEIREDLSRLAGFSWKASIAQVPLSAADLLIVSLPEIQGSDLFLLMVLFIPARVGRINKYIAFCD